MKLHLHNYSVWSPPLQTYSGHVQQWRICKICHKTDFRTHRWHNQTSITLIQKAIQELLK